MTEHSIPQDDTPQEPQIVEEIFTYSVSGHSVPGVRLIDHTLDMAIECYPSDSWLYVMSHDGEGWKKSFSIYCDDNQDKRQRLVNLIKKALGLD